MNYVDIGGIFKDVVEAVNAEVLPALQDFDANIRKVRFDEGHYLEISETLKQMSEGGQYRYEMWPLIGLFRDFSETPVQGRYTEMTATLIIATGTNPEWKTREREANRFRPILYPIYFELLNQLSLHPMISVLSADSIPHERIAHYYWGSQTVYEKGPNIFNEHTDSIELRNLTLMINNKNC